MPARTGTPGSVAGDAGYRGRRALVLGLGTRGGGEGAARYLAQRGASVTISDTSSLEALREPLVRLSRDGVSVDLSLIGRPQQTIDVALFDLVVRNPAIPMHDEILERFRRAGVEIHTEASIFVKNFAGSILGVTGTKGKTSTCYFLHHLLGGDDAGVLLVGNMGRSALDHLHGTDESSVAVVELSSFQTEMLGEHGLGTSVACLTNLGTDHLDAYNDDLEAYWSAKACLFRGQRRWGWRVHPSDLPIDILEGMPARWCCVLSDDRSADRAVYIEDGEIRWRGEDGLDVAVIAVPELPIVDSHRIENVVVAVAAAMLSDVPITEIRSRLRSLPAVPHRMEEVPVGGPVVWVNDSAASTPAAAAAAIASRGVDTRLVVICGGSSKHLDVELLRDALVEQHATCILLPGTDSVRLRDLMPTGSIEVVGPVSSVEEAVDLAFEIECNAVLLSPGCASFARDGHEGFRDVFERGGRFVAQVLKRHGADVDDDLLAELCRPTRPDIGQVMAERGLV